MPRTRFNPRIACSISFLYAALLLSGLTSASQQTSRDRSIEFAVFVKDKSGRGINFPKSGAELERAASEVLDYERPQYIIGCTPSTQQSRPSDVHVALTKELKEGRILGTRPTPDKVNNPLINHSRALTNAPTLARCVTTPCASSVGYRQLIASSLRRSPLEKVRSRTASGMPRL